MKSDAKTAAEVQALLGELAAAYSALDTERLAAVFSPDPDVSITGTGADEKPLGLTSIREKFQRDFSQLDEMHLELGVCTVSAAGPVAWATSEPVFHAWIGGQQIVMVCRMTAVLEQRDGRWLVQHLHMSVPNGDQAAGQSFSDAR